MDSSSPEEQVKPKRAPRKRAVVKRVEGEEEKVPRKAPVKRVARKRVAIDKVERIEQEERVERVGRSVKSEEVVERKAPTPIASYQSNKKKKQRQLIVVAVLMVVGIGSSAAFGFSDKGQIDVQKTIEARNERIRNNVASPQDVATSEVIVPVQNTDPNVAPVPNGGLVGGGISSESRPADTATTATASTSLDVASSTDPVASSTEGVSEEAVAPDSLEQNETEEVPVTSEPEEASL